jgi:hypothetical protein
MNTFRNGESVYFRELDVNGNMYRQNVPATVIYQTANGLYDLQVIHPPSIYQVHADNMERQPLTPMPRPDLRGLAVYDSIHITRPEYSGKVGVVLALAETMPVLFYNEVDFELLFVRPDEVLLTVCKDPRHTDTGDRAKRTRF